MKTTYSIHSLKFACEIRFTFGENQTLLGFDIADDPSIAAKDIALLLDNALTLDLFRVYCAKAGVKMTVIPADLSFKTFWDRYDYKEAGDKKDSEKKWNLLNDLDKARALAYIKIDNQHRLTSGAARKYAKTYLNQKVWEV
jgi:hypothetical protein